MIFYFFLRKVFFWSNSMFIVIKNKTSDNTGAFTAGSRAPSSPLPSPSEVITVACLVHNLQNSLGSLEIGTALFLPLICYSFVETLSSWPKEPLLY